MVAPWVSAEPTIGRVLRCGLLISCTTSACPAVGWWRPWCRRSRPLAESCAAGCSSAGRPPRVRRWDGGALVLHGDATEGVILALRVPGPVVGHLDARQSGVTVEDDAEEVVGLALVPVVGRVDRDHRRDVRVRVGAGDLEADPAVVGHRQQVVDRVQLAALVLGVVHAGDAGAELEAQPLVVAQQLHEGQQVRAPHEEGDLLAVHHDLLDRAAGPGGLDGVRDLVEPAAEGTGAAPRHRDRADQAAVPARVAGPADAEHAVPDADNLGAALGVGHGVLDRVVRGVHVGARGDLRELRGLLGTLAHRSRPFIWEVGSMLSASVSFSSISATRLDPSLVAWTCLCSLRIASMSISGRGGQPGRYMSTGTTWSTPWTIA